MHADQGNLSKKITLALVYGRPPLVFAAMICAMVVMLNQNPLLYTAGTLFLFASMAFDLIDGWFAARFTPNSILAQLADRLMDKVVYSMVFPLVAVGMMWRLVVFAPGYSKKEMLHAVFVLLMCVIVLIRDNFAHFMRGFAARYNQEPELRELTRLRTIVAAPLGVLLYAHAFYIEPQGDPSFVHDLLSRLGNLTLHHLFIIEIIFVIINFGSIAGYCRKYGTYCLDDLCLGDIVLRRRILSVFPNALTVMNAMMGLLAVFFAYQSKMTESYLLLIGAAVFDKLDGAMARKLGLTEPIPGIMDRSHIHFGGIMDDIADGLSFCVAPAWICYLCLSEHLPASHQPFPLWIAVVIYAVAGFARLAYFTLDRHPIPGFFKGMPTPAAALFVTAPLLIICQPENPPEWIRMVSYFSFGQMLFTAFLMNLYPVKYLHIGRFMDRNPWFTMINLALILTLVFTPWFGYLVFCQMLLYVLSPFITWRMNPQAFTNTSGTNPSSVS